jgi:cytochrome P450 family 144
MPTQEILPATRLLDPAIVDEPYAFYRDLVTAAPVWRVPGTDVVIVSSYAAVTEATNRVDDFSSNIRYLLYRNEAGIPDLFEFGTTDNIDVLFFL